MKMIADIIQSIARTFRGQPPSATDEDDIARDQQAVVERVHLANRERGTIKSVLDQLISQMREEHGPKH